MTEIQKAYLIGKLWQEGRKPQFIDYELMMIDRNRKGELSDVTCMIMSSHDFIQLQYI